MVAKTYPRKRNRQLPVLPKFKRNSVLNFQKVNKAKVLFNTTPMSKYSAHQIIKCEMINSVGISVFAFGSTYKQAFSNMQEKYREKLAV